MIDRAVIFTSILNKNALRRRVGLPEWPIRATYDTEIRGAAWREYARQHRDRVYAEVLARQRTRFGADYPASAGGQMAVACLVGKALRDGFLRNPD